MGSGKMGCWVNGKIRLDDVNKNGKPPYFKNQHSIVP
jgi:hypothetical protein